jgi:hypothetical protein
MGNPKKLAKYGTQDQEKQNKNATKNSIAFLYFAISMTCGNLFLRANLF